MPRIGVQALCVGKEWQRAKTGRVTESNARLYQNILRVETRSQHGQIGKTDAERPAAAENRVKESRSEVLNKKNML